MLAAVTLSLAAGAAWVGEDESCPGGSCPGEAAEDELSLLALRRASQPQPRQSYQCPGSSDRCSGNTCCPGIRATGDKTFPCPVADRSYYHNCESGEVGLLNALVAHLTKDDKWTLVRGVGWKNNTWDQYPGYYIGNAGIGLPYGIPSQNQNDNGNGFRTDTVAQVEQVTSWPCALALSAAWSEKDTEAAAQAIGREFHIKGANMILGPGVNVARVARNGRNAEYMSGESAYLGARLVKPWVRGVQSTGVLAVVKHYVNNNQEDYRDNVDAIVGEQAQQEVYLQPFRGAVEAGVASFMCSYNLVNGQHTCGSKHLLVKNLKEEMGFEGWVMSDWWALHAFEAPQVAQEMPGTSSGSMPAFFTDENLDTLTMKQLDSMVKPQLRMMIRHGLFEKQHRVCEPTCCNYSRYEAVATSPEHEALNEQLATNAVLLLKNQKGVLPLSKKVKKIALLGSACDATNNVTALLAMWNLGSFYNIGGSGRVIAHDPVSVRAGLTAGCEERGCEVLGEYEDNVEAAVELAKKADVAFICGGAISAESFDRTNLSVENEDYIVEVAKKLAKRRIPSVSVTLTPGTIVMPWAENVDGILNIFLGGQQTGTGLANVIFGKANPSAKTPLTFLLREDQAVQPCEPKDPGTFDASKDTIPCPYTEGVFVGYLGLENQKVLFPFGHGLSYTKFKYQRIGVVTTGSHFFKKFGMPYACKGASVCILAKVKNVGKRAGVEIPQLYLSFPKGLKQPKYQLKGFSRMTELKPGGSEVVSFPLYERDLQIYDESKGRSQWMSPNGKYKVSVGASSRDFRFELAFSMCKGKTYTKANRMCR